MRKLNSVAKAAAYNFESPIGVRPQFFSLHIKLVHNRPLFHSILRPVETIVKRGQFNVGTQPLRLHGDHLFKVTHCSLNISK